MDVVPVVERIDRLRVDAFRRLGAERVAQLARGSGAGRVGEKRDGSLLPREARIQESSHPHRVRALAHTPASVASLRAAGADPVPGSLFDRDTLGPAIGGARAVLHLATRIAPASVARDSAPDGRKIERSGCQRIGAIRFVSQSGSVPLWRERHRAHDG